MLAGGMVPVCTLRTTFSQTSGSSTGVGDVDLVQPQVRSLEPFVVARDAVPIEETTVTRRRRDGAGSEGERSAWAANGLLCRRFHLQAEHQRRSQPGRPKRQHSAEGEVGASSASGRDQRSCFYAPGLEVSRPIVGWMAVS